MPVTPLNVDPKTKHRNYLYARLGGLTHQIDDVVELLGHVENAGSPVGSLTPLFKGQICFDTTNGDYFIAFDETVNTGWTRIGLKTANRIVTIPDATPYTVLVANNGKKHIVADQTSSITINLPTAAAGLEYEFYSKAVAAEAQNWAIVATTPSFYLGGLNFLDNDAGAGADEVHAGVYPNGSSHLTMTIVTPCAGTYVKVFCDGTNWIVSGIVNSPTIPTFA